MLSLGLAMSLFFAQTAQAEVFITPFGEKIEVSTENQEIVPETQTEALEPGNTGSQTEAIEPGNTGNQTESDNQGPGGITQTVDQVMKPSATYSTKDPVQVTTTAQSTTSAAGVVNSSAAANIEESVVSAQGAALYDATHNVFLYEKNGDTKYYPASITKLMTALLVLENANLTDTVTFSQNAVTNLESGAVTLALKEGDQVSVKDCLYGLLLKSANEVANGLAEHVGGSISGFAAMMNAKAAAVGCTNTNFVNPNGLNNSNHYTTAHDMALIAKAAFENETLCEIASTTSYKFPATKVAGERTITMGHKMLYSSDSRYYDGIIGGKTGYTSLAGNTLVTCVERDGVRMIAVILKSSGTHYTDTKALFDYGYALNSAGAIQSSAAEVVDMSGGPGAVSASAAATQTAAYHKWIEDGSDWRFELADGTRLSNCFVLIDGKEYAFDTTGKMVTGWLTLGTSWHFFSNSGAMIRNDWRKDGDYWFYLGADGAMVRNAWIDNQYYVGEDGVWIESMTK